ncbi:Ger(x)C family spore germination protein [Paenibacillus sacheonensis]|uniref:Ger(X)C family spore germination protein n=1 Tax=Paenibacillus sacheonensis TaxID=742054 RepID=A0A7X5BZW2_9BACL|nr:Ger(x)C family spore germination protein [Paenibacillus sacheonensis]NBC67804.1 Ger(x)C family spore germination protein [Paenibacillus sacheonensis]
MVSAISRQAAGLFRSLALLVVLASTCLLAGCWDSKEMADEAFVTGIGVDFKGGEFEVSLQLLDFAAIAKTENASPGTPKVWIGVGKGKSLHAAIAGLSLSSQIEINLEQLKVVVVREPAMDKMDEILDALNRVRVSRYTAWIFGTKAELKDIFATDAFFERSQMASLIYEPKLMFRQDSLFEPMTMQRFVADYNEGAETALLPSVSVNNRTWHKTKSKMHMEQLDGLFAFKSKGRPAFFTIGEVRGIQWGNGHFNREVMTVNGGTGFTSITVRELKVKRSIEIKNGVPKPVLSVRVRSSLNELGEGMTRSEIVRLAKKQIEAEIRSAYNTAAKRGVDIFDFDETLYRHHLRTWNRMSQGRWRPGENELKVNVKLGVKYSGVFELK